MTTHPLAFLLSASLAAACAGPTSEVRYGALVNVDSPELIWLEPELAVVADADEPVFYARDAYWLYRGGAWYRSTSLDGGWVRRTPPASLATLDRPETYARYRQRAGRDLRAEAPRPPFPPPGEPDAPYPYPRPPQQVPPTLPGDRDPRDRVPSVDPPPPPMQPQPEERDPMPPDA